MKELFAIVVGTVMLLATGTSLAQGMQAPSSPDATTAQSGSSMSMSNQMGQMDEYMKKMQALHDKMMSATTPEERQKVMGEQRQEMQAGMGMMNHMQDGGMMGNMGGGMMGQKSAPADASAQMRMMQKRMDVMQMMMQTMMDSRA